MRDAVAGGTGAFVTGVLAGAGAATVGGAVTGAGAATGADSAGRADAAGFGEEAACAAGFVARGLASCAGVTMISCLPNHELLNGTPIAAIARITAAAAMRERLLFFGANAAAAT